MEHFCGRYSPLRPPVSVFTFSFFFPLLVYYIVITRFTFCQVKLFDTRLLTHPSNQSFCKSKVSVKNDGIHNNANANHNDNKRQDKSNSNNRISKEKRRKCRRKMNWNQMICECVRHCLIQRTKNDKEILQALVRAYQKSHRIVYSMK